MARNFDLVVFGPTGVAGREVARYVGRRADELGVRWAAAGRSPDRVHAVLDEVDASPAAVLTVDVADEASVVAMAEQAKVVINLVGPYARYGEVVHRACAEHGTHQLDLTGETDWLATMIGRYHDRADATGARIVSVCGFEALPFDLGTLLAATALHERTGRGVVAVDVALSFTRRPQVRAAADAVSGGTFASALDALRRGGTGTSDAHALDPATSRGQGRFDLRPRRHPRTRVWLGPVFPAPYLNPVVVHRSAALLRAEGDPVFARGFRYREGTSLAGNLPSWSAGLVGPAVAAAMVVAQGAATLVGRAPAGARGAIAKTLARLGPEPGEGPRPETLDDWSYRLDIRATTAEGDQGDVVVEALGNPGYKSTSMMVGEAGLILADATAPVPDRSGYLTPATALGVAVIERFRSAGAVFTVT